MVEGGYSSRSVAIFKIAANGLPPFSPRVFMRREIRASVVQPLLPGWE